MSEELNKDVANSVEVSEVEESVVAVEETVLSESVEETVEVEKDVPTVDDILADTTEKTEETTNNAQEKLEQVSVATKQYSSYFMDILKQPDGFSQKDEKYGWVTLLIWALLNAFNTIVLVGHAYTLMLSMMYRGAGRYASINIWNMLGATNQTFVFYFRTAIFALLSILILIGLDLLFGKLLLKHSESFMAKLGAYGRGAVPATVMLAIATVFSGVLELHVISILLSTLLFGISAIVTIIKKERFEKTQFSKIYFTVIVLATYLVSVYVLSQFFNFSFVSF